MISTQAIIGAKDIAIIVLSIALTAFIIATVILAVRSYLYRTKKSGDRADNVRVIGGVRYSKTDGIMQDGQVKATHQKDDLILQRGVTYVAEKDGNPMPGTYTVLAASDGTQRFKLRIGAFVREYKHGDTVILGQGETVCAVSGTVILR